MRQRQERWYQKGSDKVTRTQTKQKELPNRDKIFILLVQKVTRKKCVPEYRFHPTRRWRFDFAIPELKIAIEIDGGVWIQGRHNRPKGYLNDLEKFNNAAQLGWLVLKFTPREQLKTATINAIEQAAKTRIREIETLHISDNENE